MSHGSSVSCKFFWYLYGSALAPLESNCHNPRNPYHTSCTTSLSGLLQSVAWGHRTRSSSRRSLGRWHPWGSCWRVWGSSRGEGRDWWEPGPGGEQGRGGFHHASPSSYPFAWWNLRFPEKFESSLCVKWCFWTLAVQIWQLGKLRKKLLGFRGCANVLTHIWVKHRSHDAPSFSR